MILNLKQFNTHITYRHFKMESINQVIDIVRPNVYMASIDLRCLLLHPSQYIHNMKNIYNLFLYQKYQYTCMPKIYGPAMWIFTKVS